MTASLHILKGVDPGKRVAVEKDAFILGRNPDCDVIIPITSVSREHARITRAAGQFYIEDMGSRNGTFVNNHPISGRHALKNADRIRICDFIAAFEQGLLPPLPEDIRKEGEEEVDDEEAAPTVEATLVQDNNLQVLETHPADKLRALLEISENLSRTLELDGLLPKIVDSLFQAFKQADRCFIILAEDGGKLIPKVTRTRRPQDETNARFSRSIVRQCLETCKLFLSNNADNDKRILSQSVVDFRIRSVMCAPLNSADGKAFGVIQLDTQDRAKKFTEDDLKLLMGVAHQAAAALQNARLHREAQVRAQMEKEMLIAHTVQQGFLPKKMPEVPGYAFFAHYEPAQDVGGDYYGFVPMGGGRLCISVGDVAGKGVAAALLMAKLSSDVRYCLLAESELTAALSRLNDLVYQSAGQMDRFITLMAIVLDPVEHVVTVVNAGHMTPLLYRSSTGEIVDSIPKNATGLPMGIMDDQTYDATRVSLEPGDTLVLFSDGVTDADNVRNEAFGFKGIHTAIKGDVAPNPQALGERIVKAIKLHTAGKIPPKDDITLVCFGRTV